MGWLKPPTRFPIETKKTCKVHGLLCRWNFGRAQVRFQWAFLWGILMHKNAKAQWNTKWAVIWELTYFQISNRTHVSRTPKKKPWVYRSFLQLTNLGVHWDSVPFNGIDGNLWKLPKSPTKGVFPVDSFREELPAFNKLIDSDWNTWKKTTVNNYWWCSTPIPFMYTHVGKISCT